MFEKVNPSHPDKVADRIAGAIVDLAYRDNENPKVAAEVLIGHGVCHIIVETDCDFDRVEICKAVERIAGNNILVDLKIVQQDKHLAENQKGAIRCGDNGIFKGVPVTEEQKLLSEIARDIYKSYPFDGKYIISDKKLTICQSNANSVELSETFVDKYRPFEKYLINTVYINPLGDWTGGTDVDTGATNRKLGSDMGDSVTGGGLHGKDLSKADVSVNIYAWLRALELGKSVELSCSIGDETVDGKPYSQIVEIAREYIKSVGGFEKFAEWGLI